MSCLWTAQGEIVCKDGKAGMGNNKNWDSRAEQFANYEVKRTRLYSQKDATAACPSVCSMKGGWSGKWTAATSVSKGKCDCRN